MPSDSMTTLSDKVRVIFPDGLPGGVDASQVKLMIQRQPHAEQNCDGNGAAANDRTAEQSRQPNRSASGTAAEHPTATPPAQNGPNEPEPAATDACPPAPPNGQDDSAPLPSSRTRTRADASRENGRKSRGPVTPEGKARSSQNALKHGLSSRQIVIETEDEQEWLEFRDECRQTFSPVGAIELGYADEFAASRWRLNRCLGIETSIFDDEFEMQKIYDAKRCSEMDDLAKTGKAFRSVQDNLTALGRYETRIRRSGERALANLLKLQSMRQNEPSQPPAVPLPSAFGILHSSSADSLVREPAPQPVQPSAGSASVLQNEPTEATGKDPVQPSVSSASTLQNEPNNPPAATESMTIQASPASVPQNEPNELASRATLCPRGVA